MRRSSAGSRRERAPDKPRERKGQKLELPAADLVVEQAVLAAAIVDLPTRKRLVQIIPSDWFHGPGHSEAWAALGLLDREQLVFDPATLTRLAPDVDVPYLEDLARARPELPVDLSRFVELLRWDHARTELIRGPLGGLVEALADSNTAPSDVLSLARSCVSACEGHASLRYLREPSALVREQASEIQKRKDGAACHPFGLEGFDRYADGPDEGKWRMIPGLAPQKMTIVTGTPGSGKTSVAARFAVEQANRGRKVLYAAWEQGSGLTLELCATLSLGYSLSAFATGDFTDEELAAHEAEMLRLSDLIRFFEIPFDRGKAAPDKKWLLNDKRLDSIFEYLSATNPAVAIFDLWRRALGDYDPEAEEQALYRQQAMLQETRTHGILIHQLRAKEVEKKLDKRPTRDELKGSGAWFEVPDTIIGVHREALWKDVPDDVLSLIVLKQRHGRFPLQVDFDWDPDRGWIGPGRSVAYLRPGSAEGVTGSVDELLGNPASIAAMKEAKKVKDAKAKSGRKRL